MSQPANFDRFPELTALRAFRLRHDLTYRRLAILSGIPYRTLFSLLNSRNPRPYDRTLFRVRRFLGAQVGAKSLRRPRGRMREATL